MNTQIMRWGGIFALILAVAYVASFALSITHGVDIYSDDTGEILTDIHDKKELFIADVLGWALAPLLLAPVLLGWFFTVREEDRPLFALPAAAFALSSLLVMVGEAFAIGLADIATNYVEATGATKEGLLSDGETFLSLVLLLAGGAGFFSTR